MTDPQTDRSHRAAFTVTVTSRPDGGHYFDRDDFFAHVVQWLKAGLRGKHAIAEVTVAGAEPTAPAAVPSAPVDRAAVLRDFLWRLEQSAGDAAAEKFLDDNPELRRMADEAAAIASCPGYETSPSPCRCPCYGCKHHCGAHDPSLMADEEQQS